MQDSQTLRDLLRRLVPGIEITGVPAPSGQRVVYFATARSAQGNIPDGDVVLKVSGGLSPTAITYLQREIDLLAQITSPSFPALHYSEVFSSDPETEEPLTQRLFVTVEERIPGRPLADLRGNYSSERTVVPLLRQLVDAGSVLWNLRPSYVHRDIKPANILIRPDSTICLIDLGIVREEGAAGVTSTGAPMGPCTPAYCSPEQARNDKANITYKSDFFAIGIIGYELLAGFNPFCPSPHTPVGDVLYNVLSYVPPALKDVVGSSEGISSLVGRLLAKEPFQRPRTPELLRSELDRLCEGIR
jgi:serine/threonine-protein kinase